MRRPSIPYGAAGDAEAAGLPAPVRFRRHADALTRGGRSPLSAVLMCAAAADIDAGGIVAELLHGVPTPPGSVPQLRLLAALHHLVLAGRAPALAAYYPSAGGELAPDGAWPLAREVLTEHREWVRSRLHRTVQTNEPGRSTVLYATLLWLSEQHRRPLRLLEIGASAGLNLRLDHYCYVVRGQELGHASSRVRFTEPWQSAPPIELISAGRRLEISSRAGCDRNPLDPRDPEARIALLSYIWPDELERIERMRSALDIAVDVPVEVERETASRWLTQALDHRREGELTVIWQSVFRQYVEAQEWDAISSAVAHAGAQRRDAPVVWLAMEPDDDHVTGMRVTMRLPPMAEERQLARCADHGPPVVWLET